VPRVRKVQRVPRVRKVQRVQGVRKVQRVQGVQRVPGVLKVQGVPMGQFTIRSRLFSLPWLKLVEWDGLVTWHVLRGGGF
jgi:hypothetical protein